MKARWRITIQSRRRELAALVENKLVEHDKSNALFAHTYPYRTVSEVLAEAVVLAEKGKPHLWKPDEHRRADLIMVVSKTQSQFDWKHSWYCRYDHEKAATYVVDAIVRAEITR